MKKTANLFNKIISLAFIIAVAIITLNIAKLGISEIETLYFHVLIVLSWLGTAALGI